MFSAPAPAPQHGWRLGWGRRRTLVGHQPVEPVITGLRAFASALPAGKALARRRERAQRP